MKRIALLSLMVVALASCGGSQRPRTNGPHASCAQASAGHGAPGACAPKQQLGLTAPHPLAPSQPTYQDRSNNNPCYCGATIRAQGHAGLIVKANQGTGFIDGTAVGMVQSARAAGLAVGEYDFDQNYTVAEAQVFVARLHAAGIYPHTRNTFPAYFDVEYGNFNYNGLLAQIAYVRAQGYRVGVYTGAWYWGPHAGCRWPAGVSAWLSGYPNAPVPCGTTGYNSHQFTATPIDMSVFLGSRAQFSQFVNAPRPWCSPVWGGPCPTPKPRPKPKPLPVCITHRLAKAECSAAKAKVARDKRALAASWRAFDAANSDLARNGCRRPYRRRICRVSGRGAVLFTHRIRYFAAQAAKVEASS